MTISVIFLDYTNEELGKFILEQTGDNHSVKSDPQIWAILEADPMLSEE